MRKCGKPEKTEAYSYYPCSTFEAICGQFRERLDLIFEVWSTSQRVWRIAGTDIKLDDETVALMNQAVLAGKARMIKNLHFKP